MLELLINPKKAEKSPWKMLFIGFFYASLAVFLSQWIFAGNPVLAQYLGIFVIMFCVIFSMPYMYYAIKNEERKDLEYDDELPLLKEHGKALLAFLFLFLGFVIAFSVWYIVIPDSGNLFKAQIETFCQINGGSNYQGCVKQYMGETSETITGAASSSTDRLFSIFANNIYVLLFTLVLSLIFGAGAIFILAWNASVIAAAIGIFAKNELHNIHLGFARYMVFHGVLEIAAYFVAALAGGILSVAIIKHDTKSEKFWAVVQDSLNLIIISIGILFVAALIEVFITPSLFS